ncbi:hypothetical protein EDC04DRAFT_3090109 [Pisolithus marmoratus]|nr:hypothetical protein EDC04DRAFT_3090109 [Pisolithus marmoratus]
MTCGLAPRRLPLAHYHDLAFLAAILYDFSRPVDIELRDGKDIESVNLVLGSERHPIPRQGKGTFLQQFDEPLPSATDQLSLDIRRKRFFGSLSVETVTINVQPGSERQVITRGKVVITLGVYPSPLSADTASNQHSLPTHEGLKPTTEELIKQCPRFRILVVGKTGAGKSSLINRVFGIENAHVADDKPGEATIEKELISSQNDRFILHDSRGFEPAEGGNYDTVKSFIETRKRMRQIKDRLHAVWFCFPVPIIGYGERLLEEGTETFLKQSNKALGNIPTVVVFTKYDRLVAYMQIYHEDPETKAKEYLQKNCVEPIQEFLKNKDILHVAVSSNPKCEQGHDELTALTFKRVSESFASSPDMLSPVPFAAAGAQRMVPKVKIESSINVGKQRYWRVLASSPNFPGFTMLDCLRVIHTDIILSWNFNDSSMYLSSEEFRNLMINMVDKMDAPTKLSTVPTASSPALTRPTRSDTFAGGGVPLVAAMVVLLPFVAGIALVQWVNESYRRLQNVHQKFMAYIVDLTHVLEILFALTDSKKEKKLTRTAIKLAFNAYFDSLWMGNVHESITQFKHTIKDRDEILEKIEALILASGETHVTSAVKGIPPVDLEQDEEWY